MQEKDFFIGTLKQNGYLKTESDELLLTRIPMQAAQSPESALLKITSKDIDKRALVQGHLSGNVLYSANIIEILSPVTALLFKNLLEKGAVSLEEFKKQLSELESQEVEGQEKRKLCALVIGHKKTSPGAKNARTNLTEFDFNEDLALRIEKKVQKAEIQRIYRRTWKELPNDINALEPDFIVSLHCNAFNTRASGTEVLYYYKSENGMKMADVLLGWLVKQLKLSNRGIKPKTAEDRGGLLLRYTKAPCIISEPFFIDNNTDLAKVQEDIEGLAAAYANAIDEISLIV